MALRIDPDGTTSTHTPKQAGGPFELAELYQLLDCSMVQAVSLADGAYMFMDEEGKLRTPPKPRNRVATLLLAIAGGHPEDHVVGPVMILSAKEAASEAPAVDPAGRWAVRVLPGAEWALAVEPLLGGLARLHIYRLDEGGVSRDVWDYPSRASAKRALDAWNGRGEPQGWHRHPRTGRRRPDGDPALEFRRP